MKYLLICPGSRERFQLPGDPALPLVPMLGQTLLEYWLSHLSAMGTREVTILADTALDEIRKLVGGGERWGLKAAVQAESRELSVALAGLKYGGHGPATEDTVVLLDHFPGHPMNLCSTPTKVSLEHCRHGFLPPTRWIESECGK